MYVIAMSNYYNEKSKEFIRCILLRYVLRISFFKQYLTCARTILDICFGSGRDSLYFKNKGYEVYSLDPTLEFCQNAKALGLKHIYQMKAQDIKFKNIFDGIWACASLLHVPSNELNATLKNVVIL